jgi:CBS domain-containing protein
MPDSSPATGTSADDLSAEPTVGPLMQSPAPTVEADAHVASAAYLLKRAAAGALVVTADDLGVMPIAVLTDVEVSHAVADGLDPNETRINQLRLPRPVPVYSGTSVTEAAEQMLGMSLHHLPVVDDGRLVGVVGVEEVCRALLRRKWTP